MIPFFKSKSISKKIMTIYGSVSVLCVIILTVVMYYFTSVEYQDAYISSIHNSFNLSVNNFSNIIQGTTVAVDNLIYTDSSFIEHTSENTGYLVKDAKNFQEATDTLKYALSPVFSDPNIRYKAILFLDDSVPLSKICPDVSYNINKDKIRTNTVTISNSSSIKDSHWYNGAINSYGEYYWFTIDNDATTLYGARHIYLSTVENYNVSKSEVGVFVLAVDADALLSQIYSIKGTKNSCVILKTPSNDFNLENKQIPDENYALYTTNIAPNLDVEIYTPTSDMYSTIWWYIELFIVFILIIFVLLIVVIRYITRHISKPITHLSSHMTDNPSMNPISTENMNDDEIKTIYQSYNAMLNKTKELMVSIEEETAKHKDWEFKMHQMQINPHFIYNSINNITCRLMIKGDHDTASTLGLLSKHLRYNFSEPFNEITLENELEQLKNYIEIQRAQYQDRFNFEINVNEKFMKCKVIKMLLQPLVENAITYGIGLYYDDVLKIRVSCEATDDCLFIYVSDNFKLENVETINEHISGRVNISKKSGGLGTRNIDRRIKIKYGENFGLHYFNTETETVAKISVPLHYDEALPPPPINPLV